MSDTANNLNATAEAIHTRRKALGLTQLDLAEMCSIQRQTVGRLENADPTVSLGTAMAVADVLGLETRLAAGGS